MPTCQWVLTLINAHLPAVADSNAVEQFEELLALCHSDDLTGCGAVVRVLLPTPHHQLAQQQRAGEVLQGSHVTRHVTSHNLMQMKNKTVCNDISPGINGMEFRNTDIEYDTQTGTGNEGGDIT